MKNVTLGWRFFVLPVVLKEQAAKGSRSERIVGERNLKQREPTFS